jgi:hypothetical protein
MPVAEREMVCGDEDSARAQVERLQQLEQDPDAEWIYLRNRDGRGSLVVPHVIRNHRRRPGESASST